MKEQGDRSAYSLSFRIKPQTQNHNIRTKYLESCMI